MRHAELHRLTLRIWHWVNTVLIFLLILTAVRLRIPDAGFLFSYRNGVLIHRWIGLAACVSFLFWLAYSLVNGNIARHYAFRPGRDVKGMVKAGALLRRRRLHGLAQPLSRDAGCEVQPSPEGRLWDRHVRADTPCRRDRRPLRRHTPLPRHHRLIGGTRVLDAVHVAVAYLFVIYLIVHVYMATLGPTPFTHIKAMFTGYEEEPENERADP